MNSSGTDPTPSEKSRPTDSLFAYVKHIKNGSCGFVQANYFTFYLYEYRTFRCRRKPFSKFKGKMRGMPAHLSIKDLHPLPLSFAVPEAIS
jgi:hypothetical protein